MTSMLSALTAAQAAAGSSLRAKLAAAREHARLLSTQPPAQQPASPVHVMAISAANAMLAEIEQEEAEATSAAQIQRAGAAGAQARGAAAPSERPARRRQVEPACQVYCVGTHISALHAAPRVSMAAAGRQLCQKTQSMYSMRVLDGEHQCLRTPSA